MPNEFLLVLDEGHELADRVTSVISDELTAGAVEGAARRARKAEAGDTGRLEDAGAMFEAALEEAPEGRFAQGLPEFISDDAPLENTDVVLWYTLGAHHIVRPEDWPVMPCAYTGFHLKPIGFFDGNPALDIPPTPPKACHASHHAGLPVAERALES